MGGERGWIKYDPSTDALYITSTRRLDKKYIHMVEKAVEVPTAIKIVYRKNRTRTIVGLEITKVSRLLKPIVDSLCLQTNLKS